MLEDRTLGDLIIKLPFLDRIKGEKIVLLCDKNNSAILRYFLPEIDVLEIGCERFVSQPIYRYQVTREICADGLPRAVSILTPYNNLAIMRTGAKILSPERYVYKGEKVQDAIKLGTLEKDFCFIENPFESDRLIDAHISEHVRVIFENLFQREFKLSRSDYVAFFTKFKKKERQEGGYIVLVVDAGEEYRSYDQHNWQMVVDNFPATSKMVVLGSKKISLQHANIANLTGRTTLAEAIDLVLNADLTIGNETGLTHLAYLSGSPTVCILGGGHWGRFLPWDIFDDLVECVYEPRECAPCGWRCNYTDLRRFKAPCMERILPEKVVAAVRRLDKKFDLQIFKADCAA